MHTEYAKVPEALQTFKLQVSDRYTRGDPG